jgi:CO/xanthine dehydrogenase FAD-binding subunit
LFLAISDAAYVMIRPGVRCSNLLAGCSSLDSPDKWAENRPHGDIMDLIWHLPRSLDELTPLLETDARIHGGGTGILRNRPRAGSIVSLSELGWDDVDIGATSVNVGSTVTFAQLIDALGAEQPDHIVRRALCTAASPALRNLITVGGSVALCPPWSSIVGPLLASNAQVELVGKSTGSIELSEYLATHEFRSGSVIRRVQFERTEGAAAGWYVFRRTRGTYPIFTMSTLMWLSKGTIERCRIVLTGTRGRFAIPRELQKRLTGSAPGSIELRHSDLATVVPARHGFSSEYLTHVATVALTRMLNQAGSVG